MEGSRCEGYGREGKGREGKAMGVGVGLGGLHTFEVAAALGLEFFPPAPDGVEDQAHAHAAFDFEL